MALQWITYKIGFLAIFFSILSTIQHHTPKTKMMRNKQQQQEAG